MFTQREMDIALVESRVEVQQLLQEWVEDYLGSRLDATRERDSAGDASGQEAEGANIQPQAQAY